MEQFHKLFQMFTICMLAKRYAEGLSTLSAGRRIAEGVPYSLVCTESSAITTSVLFFKNNVNQGGCISSTCNSLVSGYSVTQNTTSTTLHIDSVDGTREAGSWTCQHGSDPESLPIVIALPIPSYLNESSITTDPNQGSIITPPQVIVVSVPCAYPVPTVTGSYSKNGVPTTISGNNNLTNCPLGRKELNSSLNTASIKGTGNITLTVKVEHDSFNPANKYARLFTFEVNFGVPDCIFCLIIIIIALVLVVLLLIIYHLVIFFVKVSFLVMGILFFVNAFLAVVAVAIGIVVCVLYAEVVELILAIIAIVIGVLTLLYKLFFSKHVLKKADVPHRHLFGGFCAYPWKTGDASGDETNTEMKNQNDPKKDDKKDDKKHDKKDDKEKKDEKNVESEDPTGRPLPPRTTQKTSDFASPKPKMKPKEGNGEELKPLRDAPRGGLPSPRVNHNDNDSASSASNVTPHVA